MSAEPRLSLWAGREVARRGADGGGAGSRRDQQVALDEAGAALTKVSQASRRITEVVGPKIDIWAQEDNSNLVALEDYGRGK